jgi:hypothetical protein
MKELLDSSKKNLVKEALGLKINESILSLIYHHFLLQ